MYEWNFVNDGCRFIGINVGVEVQARFIFLVELILNAVLSNRMPTFNKETATADTDAFGYFDW